MMLDDVGHRGIVAVQSMFKNPGRILSAQSHRAAPACYLQRQQCGWLFAGHNHLSMRRILVTV